MNLRRTATICVFAWLAGAVSPVIASGPLYVTGPAANQPGQPYRWNNSSAISYTTDQGKLGNQSNAQANTLVSDAFAAWHNVSTASISFTNAGQLGADITDKNILTYANTVGDCTNTTVPTNSIIYDVDGSAIEAYGEDKNSVLGFAGPVCFDDAAGTYTRGWAVLNGWFIDGSSTPPGTSSHYQYTTDEFRAVFVHEFGHLLGLDHSQINLNCLTDEGICPDDDLAGVPIMFPVLVDYKTTPTADDAASISNLYPSGTYDSSTGRIQGRVVFSDGETPAQGYNVIARRVGDGRITAVSNVSGYLFTPCGDNTLAPEALRSCASEYYYSTSLYPWGSDDETLIGYYDLPGLPPGDYTIEVEAIYNTGDYAFVDGSGVGPIGASLGFQFKMPGSCAPQYLNDPSSTTDSCSAYTTLTVGAGSVVDTHTDIILLGTPPRYDAWEDGP